MLFVGVEPKEIPTVFVVARSTSANTVSKVTMSYNWTITSLVPKLCVTVALAVIVSAKVDSPFKNCRCL